MDNAYILMLCDMQKKMKRARQVKLDTQENVYVRIPTNK